ncbi:hypothetical protein CEXT_147811 [Caerostris extrusa]|uniref:Serine/threonine-protein phosphatase 6 regulatory subunit 3 n=2 Tax=Caerostris extrusa TaxID=172846 RepID=A0AAV4MPB0_CAEEX|nr:hypothetical protein CEXT_147811 [Caerostris extrusa]
MFWRYNLITGSCIETLLDKENVTLKELMDEEDILQECKAQSKKLLDFLVRPEILNEMVTLIIEEPKDDGEERMRYRYANKACEMLTFDIAQINDALVNDETLLVKLYNFLTTDEPLNPLLASFYSKTMGLLISKKTEFMYEFLKERDFIALILKHLDTSAIMDLLLRFMVIENNEMRTIIIKWLDEQKLIQQLISRIDIEYGEEFNCNASNALCDIIKVSREQMSLLQEKAEPNPLLETIESVEVISELLNHMFKDVTKESAIVNGILVLLSLLVFKKQGPAGIQQMPMNQGEGLQADNAPSCFVSLFNRNSETEQITALDVERLERGVSNVLTAITPRLEDFHNLLLKPPVKPAITFTIGCLDPPLGICRLEVAHLQTALLYTNNQSVNAKLASLGTIVVLLDMFFKYSWNNFLHTQVEQAIGRIITNPPNIDKEGNKIHLLLDQILTQYKITVKILECFDEEVAKSAPGSHRKGYMGHLTKIANHLDQNAENGINSTFIQEKIKQLSDEHQKKWEEFVSEKLIEINKKNRIFTVNGPPMSNSSADEETIDFRNLPFAKGTSVHLTFSDNPIHEMTSNFVDQFGFNDDDFEDAHESLIYARNSINPSPNFSIGEGNSMRSSELFEEVCNAKMNPDGDAVLWSDRENPTTFTSCFRLNKSVEENSSDSDEESQVFESENTAITLNSEEMKMDVDSQEPILDGVPMDVAPVTIPNPWETTSSGGSSDDANWADFSNFGSFDPPADQTDDIGSSVSIAMETSDVMSEKCAVDSSSVLVSEAVCDDSSKINSLDSGLVDEKQKSIQSNCSEQPCASENASSKILSETVNESISSIQ